MRGLCGLNCALPSQRLRLSDRGGHNYRKESLLSAAAAGRSIRAIR